MKSILKVTIILLFALATGCANPQQPQPAGIYGVWQRSYPPGGTLTISAGAVELTFYDGANETYTANPFSILGDTMIGATFTEQLRGTTWTATDKYDIRLRNDSLVGTELYIDAHDGTTTESDANYHR